jgi:hypothetical protein
VKAAATLLPAALLLGCADPRPTIEILDASPEALSASDDTADDLTLTVRYLDADGDLGQGAARVVDCRAEDLATVLPIPRIAADEAVESGVPIQGEMSLVVSDIGAVPPSDAVPAACADLGVGPPAGDAQSFCVVLVDAAGNASDGACTKPVRVAP